MRLAETIDLYAGGPGSGCHGPNCGRPQTNFGGPPVADIPKGKTTEDVWRDPVTKNWKPEREAWHQAFAEAAIAGKVPPTNRKPVAIIMGGGTASGKSTLAKKIVGDNPNYVRVDADGIKPQIPEHATLKLQEGDQPDMTTVRNTNLAASRVHEESSYMAKLILAKAAANKLDVIYDATSSGKGLAIMINQMEHEGYDVHLLFADVPEHIATQRAAMRALDASDPAGFGRKIPKDAMHNTHVLSAANFIMMKDSPMLASAKLYDTRGDEPHLVYQGGRGEKGHVKDDAVWKYYKKKATGRSTAW